jgi:dihydrofolate reductase
MAKLIASMNMTLDGFCDHTEMIADDEIHQHYNEMLKNAGALIYGRKTYQLMESYWPAVVKEPTGNGPTDEFAILIDNVQKIVYSRTLDKVEWKNSVLKHEISEAEIAELKKKSAKDVFVGSPGMIAEFTRRGLIDEYQLGVQPTILGKGLQLFKDISQIVNLKLLKTKSFSCGAVFLYYETIN